MKKWKKPVGALLKKTTGKTDVLSTALKAVDYYKLVTKINTMLDPLNARVIDIRDCYMSDYLLVVLSKKEVRKDFMSSIRYEAEEGRSYIVHYFNLEDQGLFSGKYDLTLAQAEAEFSLRSKT